MRDQTARTVADILFREYIRDHGVPESLHSDQGRQFEADICQELCALLEIYKSRTTPYHPQGNGMVERFNETLKNMIAKNTKNHGRDWDLHLGPVALAYNSSIHESTGFSPFYLLHGREPRLPPDVIYGTPTPHYWRKAGFYAKDLHKDLQLAFESTRDNLALAQKRQRTVYDKWARHHPYRVGDRVWLLTFVSKHRHRKLALPWEAPT
jgi:transposase InsO family protein